MGSHRWKFFRAGGVDQVKLESGADLAALPTLDPKLWVALACPTHGLEVDARTLELLDADRDGRLRSDDVAAAARWATSMLKRSDDLLAEKGELSLSAIDEASDEGRALVDAARAVLETRGKAEATSVTVEDASGAVEAFEKLPFNGDGIIVAESASDEGLKKALGEVIDCLGPVVDRTGKPGIDQATLEAFFAELAAHVAWLDQAVANPSLLPLGERTLAAAEALAAVRAKVDDYFVRCKVAAFDPRAATALNRDEKDFLLLSARDISAGGAELEGFPLARVEAGRALPLSGAVNPAWAARLSSLATQVVTPLVGPADALTDEQWRSVVARFDGYHAWKASCGGPKVAKLGPARARELLASKAREQLGELIAKDKAQEPRVKRLESVEKLVRLHRDLVQLCRNFVSFADFYSGKGLATFQAGTLYLDRRACALTLRVHDPAKHTALATASRMYLAYCDCTRAGGEKMGIAAAFTAGDSDNLMVGRNGLFVDRKGRAWDATITRIVDAPISIRQAFWSPYKKLARFVEEQVTKRAAAADSGANAQLAQAATHTQVAVETGKEPPKPKLDVGVVAALGVAVGGLTAAVGALMQALFGLGFWMPVGFVGLVLAISGPSMLLAALKLRQRNVGPLLDANGWAVNALTRVNIPFGGSLTQVAALPRGAVRELGDPFADKKRPTWLYVTLAVLALAGLLWFLGKFDPYLPERVRRAAVLGPLATEPAPAKAKAAAAP